MTLFMSIKYRGIKILYGQIKTLFDWGLPQFLTLFQSFSSLLTTLQVFLDSVQVLTWFSASDYQLFHMNDQRMNSLNINMTDTLTGPSP